MPALAERLAEVRERIALAAERSGRSRDSVTLVAVGKTQPADVVAEAVRAGATDLGENRVQEAAVKRPGVPPAVWHLIGPLQRNKARLALETFDVFQTIDRPRLVERLQLLLEEHWPGRTVPVFLEVNIASEPQKAGVLPGEALELAREVVATPVLDLQGLMCIPPADAEAEASRPHFRRLAELRRELEQRLGRPLPALSMGMSHDFEVAVEEGATHVRVGTAIFGPRRPR
ncbi:MAG TPA: YggS family pyridoxal phosphate-dependent enzyme [Acidobacteria bacterium]|nr:YggS family pyridoxal phosphate-dependent enzyme [Acidobacteriota bacterium]